MSHAGWELDSWWFLCGGARLRLFPMYVPPGTNLLCFIEVSCLGSCSVSNSRASSAECASRLRFLFTWVNHVRCYTKD